MAVQHLRDGAVAKQAGGEGDLEAEPVLALTDVEDVARVGRTSLGNGGLVGVRLFDGGGRCTLFLLSGLHLREGNAERFAVVDVKFRLTHDMPYDLV